MSACQWCGAPRAQTPRNSCDRYCTRHCLEKRHEHDCERGWNRAKHYADYHISRRRTAVLYVDATVIAADPVVTSVYGEPQL